MSVLRVARARQTALCPLYRRAKIWILLEKRGITTMEHSFILHINGTEHWEWQGQVARQGDAPIAFQSVLELLKILTREMEKDA